MRSVGETEPVGIVLLAVVVGSVGLLIDVGTADGPEDSRSADSRPQHAPSDLPRKGSCRRAPVESSTRLCRACELGRARRSFLRAILSRS